MRRRRRKRRIGAVQRPELLAPPEDLGFRVPLVPVEERQKRRRWMMRGRGRQQATRIVEGASRRAPSPSTSTATESRFFLVQDLGFRAPLVPVEGRGRRGGGGGCEDAAQRLARQTLKRPNGRQGIFSGSGFRI